MVGTTVVATSTVGVAARVEVMTGEGAAAVVGIGVVVLVREVGN